MTSRGYFRRTTLLTIGLLAFLIGLALARRVRVDNMVVVVCSVLVLLPLLRRRNILSLLSIIIIGLLLGCWRGTVYMQKLLPYHSLAKKPVSILATATSDSVYGEKAQITFDVSDIQLAEPYARKLVGTIGVKGFGEQMIYRGDVVEVQAKLYPARGSRQASMSFARIHRVRKGDGIVDKMRREFAAGLQSSVPEPLGSLGLGILIGQRTTLPGSLNDNLSIVGLTHIVAVSGYNLTIMVNLAHRLAKQRSKYQATVLTLGFVTLFLAITGSSASIVRAALVSLLSLWAWYYGRAFKPWLLILFSAVLTAGIFPPYLWSDLGWYLSFLAFVGVLILAPLFHSRFLKRKPKILVQLLIETISAQILTLPIILFIFGRLSVIALVANMLVVPLTPIAMGLTFVAGLAGMLAPTLAGWVAWPATLTMTYMVDVVNVLARLPKASMVVGMRLWQLVCAYVLVLLLMVVWWQKAPKNGKIGLNQPAPLTESVVAD